MDITDGIKEKSFKESLIEFLNNIINSEFPHIELIDHENEVILYNKEKLNIGDIEKLNLHLEKYEHKFLMHNPSLAYLTVF